MTTTPHPRASGAARTAGVVAVGVLLLLGAGCGNDGDADASGLPACATGLPVPAAVEVVEVTATPTAENPTCAVVLASDDPIDEVVASFVDSLDDAGVLHAVQQQPGRQAVLRLDGPVCGSVLIYAAGTERVTDAVALERTPALVSITECPAG